jgi:hypothetical protein
MTMDVAESPSGVVLAVRSASSEGIEAVHQLFG